MRLVAKSIACALAVVLAQPVRAGVEDGEVKFDAKSIQAQNEDKELEAARMLLLQRGDKEAALPHLRKLAGRGNTYAMFHIYDSYLRDPSSVSYDPANARGELTRCASLGNIRCLNALAELRETGSGGFLRDVGKARMLYGNACRNQFEWTEASPCFRLGKMYMEGGDGFQADKKQARYWWGRYVAITNSGTLKLRESGYAWPLR